MNGRRLLVAMAVFVAVLIGTGATLLGSHLWHHGPETAFFGDIRGLDVRPFSRYDRLIQTMGQPHTREAVTETIERWDGTEFIRELQILHYDGITFFVNSSNHEISYFVITGEQFTLGGRNRIGVGSTRDEVMADFRQRRANPFQDCSCSRIRWAYGPYSLENGAFRYWQHFTIVEFEFDENDVVVRMRISGYG